MDQRKQTLVLTVILAGTGSAFAGTAAIDAHASAPDPAIDQFVGFLLDGQETAIRVAAETALVGAVTDDAKFDLSVLRLEGVSIDLGAIGADSSQRSLAESFGGSSWHINLQPANGVFLVDDGGGMGSISNIPLPAPFAMGGIGLLAVGGYAAARRRRV